MRMAQARSQPLGAYHLAHGYADGVMLPFVMEFNLPVCKEKFAAMAAAMGEERLTATTGELAEQAIVLVKKLYLELGFPNKLDEKEVNPKDIPDMVERAKTRPQWKVNIRRSTDKDLAGIYEKAFKGWEL